MVAFWACLPVLLLLAHYCLIALCALPALHVLPALCALLVLHVLHVLLRLDAQAAVIVNVNMMLLAVLHPDV